MVHRWKGAAHTVTIDNWNIEMHARWECTHAVASSAAMLVSQWLPEYILHLHFVDENAIELRDSSNLGHCVYTC